MATPRQLGIGNSANWILVRLHHHELLLPRYLFYVLQHKWMQGLWSHGYHAGRGSTSLVCIRTSDVAALTFSANVGPIQLRQLALVKRCRPNTQIHAGDIIMRRCSGTRRLVGEPIYVKAA